METQIDEAQHWYMLHSYSQWDIEVLEYTKDKDKTDGQTTVRKRVAQTQEGSTASNERFNEY